MPAITKFEAVKFMHGPISPEITTFEPDFENIKTPTRIRHTRRNKDGLPYKAIDQELDDQGRLVATRLDNHHEPYLIREWTGDDTYVDTLSDGGKREVIKEDNGALVVVIDDKNKEWVLSTEEYEDQTIYFARSPLISPSEGNLFIATVDSDGRLETEEVWNAYDYEEGFSPLQTYKYEYDGDGNLAAVKRMHGSGDSGYFDSIERYARPDLPTSPKVPVLDVEVAYIVQPSGDELVGRKERRFYDQQARVTDIISKVSVPTSAMIDELIEISYE